MNKSKFFNLKYFWFLNFFFIITCLIVFLSYKYGLITIVKDESVTSPVYPVKLTPADYKYLIEIGAFKIDEVLVNNAILKWLDNIYYLKVWSSKFSTFFFNTIPFWYLKLQLDFFKGNLEVFWFYFFFLMLFFSGGILSNYKLKKYNAKYAEENEQKRINIFLYLIRYLTTTWLFFNFIFITIFIIQFDFISSGFFIVNTLNGFDLFLCCFKIFLLASYCMFLVIYRDLTMYKTYRSESEIHFLKFEFLMLTGFFIFGSLVLLSSSNFIEVFLALEIQSYTLYILAGSDRARILSSEAGLKYFIFGSFSSLIGLLGIAILYFETGLFDVHNVFLFISGDFSYNLCGLGITLFLLNFFFKLGIFPFHFWMPDVFHGSHLLYTIFFASISKIAPFGYFVYFCSNFLSVVPEFSFLLFFVSIISIIIGSISAFGQYSIKKLIGYSSISNLGFCTLILANDFANVTSIVYSVGYFVIYIITILGFFTILATLQLFSLSGKVKNLDNFKDLHFLDSVSVSCMYNYGIYFKYVNFSIFFCIFVFSFAGIPPFLGFFAKFYILYGLRESNFFFNLDFSPWADFILYLVLFFVILMAFYYLRLVKYTVFSSKHLNEKKTGFILKDKQIKKNDLKAKTFVRRLAIEPHVSKLAIFQILILSFITLFGLFFYGDIYDFIYNIILYYNK